MPGMVISWSALFCGAIAGVGLNFLLNLFALAIGIASFSVSANGMTEFSLPGFAFFGFSAVIAMFTTGWVAAKLTPFADLHRAWGILIGFLAWSLLLVMTIVLLTNMIHFAAFHANFTANLVAIKITGNAPMLTETLANQVDQGPLSVNLEMGKKVITINAFLTFCFFLLGALSSCIGGFIGLKNRD